MNINRLTCGIRMLAVLTLCPILVPAKVAVAQTPSARVHVDSLEVTVGDTLRLVLEIRGVREIEQISRPRLPGLSWPGLAYETAVGVKVGGAGAEAAESSFTLSYELVASATGPYPVGPFRITADGETIETETVTVQVNPREGAQATVVAWVTRERVRVGDSFGLSAQIRGSSFTEHEFIRPDVFDFAEPGGGSSEPFEHTWSLRAVAPGEFVIPPVRVTGPEGTFESEPLTVVIDPPEVEVQAIVEAGSIWVGGEFILKLEVTGVAELDEEPVLPETGAFADLIGLVDSRSRVANVPSEAERDYRFRAVRAGRFQVGPVSVDIGGRTLASAPITIVVDEVPTLEEDPPNSPVMVGSPDKTRAYVNEPVIVTYAIAYDRMASAGWPSPGTASWPSFEGFRVLELRPGAGPRDLLVDGRPFEEQGLRRVVLLPREPGQLSVDGGFAEARALDRFAGLNRATGRPAMTSIVLASEPFTVEVLPLPDEGRPASFRGYVGTISINSWVDRTRVTVGETMTLEVEVSVRGHVETLPDPEIDFPDGFTVSDPEIGTDFRDRRGELSGTRTYTYRLTAVAPGSYRIPAVEMSYFDAESESYGTASGQPFTITVVPAGSE